jgi:NAD(P)-dependent dehydrogenase (short-subunit alcohol dehydrogenase family)
MGVTGKVVVVTGASRGLGRAAAAQLVSQGARVAALARSEGDLQSLAAECESGPGELMLVPADLTFPEAVADAFQRIDRFGTLHCLVNNAGAGLFSPFESVTSEQLDAILAVNFKATFYCAQQAFTRMKAAGGGGHIVNVISTSGKLGRNQESAYVSAKWAVAGLTESLKLEGRAHRIRVTGFFPGGMATPFWDTGYTSGARADSHTYMAPAEVARILVHLLEVPESMVVDDIVIKRL